MAGKWEDGKSEGSRQKHERGVRTGGVTNVK